MLFASKEANVKRLCMLHSSTYGDSTSMPKVEDKIKPLSYAVMKYVNELYADFL
jgi:hypothetical protein